MPLSAPAQPIAILAVDDEELLLRSCRQILKLDGYDISTEKRGKAALESVRRQAPDIVLLDLNLPDMDGMDLLRQVKSSVPDALIIIITAFATVDSSLEAIEAGAHDYIPKPFSATQLRILIARAAHQVQLIRDNALLRDQLRQQNRFENIIGSSGAMQRVFSIITRVSTTDATVFLSGESGTGKELVARAIHGHSRRAEQPFIAINCAALPEHLLESELFGHERGAFTGAESQHRGLLEIANGGTFFLDEICEMSFDLQAKLLRFIQERSIRRVGGEAEIPIDVRLISATNRDPDKAVREGVFRQDLFFRLNVVPIRIPPLRLRSEDIPALVTHFLQHYGTRYDRPSVRLCSDVMGVLRAYPWPGNVRELENVIARLVSLAIPGEEIQVGDLPEELTSRSGSSWSPFIFTANRPYHEAKAEAMSHFEQEYLRDLLARHAGNISRAAREAGMDRKTIHRMLSKYEMDSGRS
jgi:DNA-binding NtrC family response regulator